MRIVVVDDDPDMREAVSLNLKMDGHDVMQAGDGVEGLHLIKTVRPDLVVADIRMPNMDGDEMFRILREEPGDLEVMPIIFLSGDVGESERIDRLNIGADHCLEKPIRMRLLRAHVNSCLARSKRNSAFMARKLNAIASTIPQTVEHSFSPFRSAFDNISEYVDLLVESIEHLCAGQTDEKIPFVSEKDTRHLPLKYVRFCLNQLDRRRQIVRSLSSDALTWWLIFTVAEAQFAKQEIFVSDLYVSAPSAKTTINSRINMLIGEGVVEKTNHADDGRRQNLTLNAAFEEILIENIETSLKMIRGIVAD